MATNIGPKIGIEGEAKYRAEIQQIIQQGKTLAAQMGSVSTSFASAESKEAAMTKQTKVLSDQIKNQKTLVEKMRDAVEKSTAKTGENSTQTQKWKEQLYKAETELHRLENQTEDNTDSVDDFSKSEETSTQKTRIFGDVLKASLLSDAIKSGMKFLIDSAKKLGKSLADAAKGAASYADEILTLSTQTGISTEALQEYRYMAGLLDVDLSTITGSHTKLIKSMAAAEKGSGAQYEAFEKLGVSIKGTNGQLRSADDVFDDVIDTLGKVKNETERDTIAMSIFGKSAQELNPLIKAGKDQLNAFKKEANDTGAVLDRSTLRTLASAQDQFDRMGKAAEVLKNRIGAGIFKTFSKELAEATKIMQDFASGKSSPEVIEARLDKLFDSILKKIGQAGDKAAPYVWKMFEKIIDFAAKNFPKAARKILDKLPEVMTEIGNSAEKLIPKIMSGIGKTIGTILANLPDIVRAGNNLAISLVKGIVIGLKEAAVGAFDEMKNPYNEAVRDMIDDTQRLKKEIELLPKVMKDFASGVDEADEKYAKASYWFKIYEELTEKTDLSKTEQEKLNSAVQNLIDIYPELGDMLNDDTGKWDLNTDAIKRNIDMLYAKAKAEAYRKAADSALSQLVEYETALTRTNDKLDVQNTALKTATDAYNASSDALEALSHAQQRVEFDGMSVAESVDKIDSKTKNYLKSLGYEITTYEQLIAAWRDLTKATNENADAQINAQKAVDELTEQSKTLQNGITDLNKEIDWFFGQASKYQAEATQIGTQLGWGIVHGMNQMRPTIVNTAGSLVTSAINRMKNIALIASPSKVTENLIGKNLALGVVKGFKDVTDSRATMDSAFDMIQIFDALKSAGSKVTNNNNSNTTNMGGVSVNVYTSPNQDEHAIARAVIAEMTNTFNSKKAVFA